VNALISLNQTKLKVMSSCHTVNKCRKLQLQLVKKHNPFKSVSHPVLHLTNLKRTSIYRIYLSHDQMLVFRLVENLKRIVI